MLGKYQTLRVVGFCLIAFMPPLAAFASDGGPKSHSFTLCETDKFSFEQIQERILKEIVFDKKLREDLVLLLESGAGIQCRNAIAQYLKMQLENKEKTINDKGRLPLILLGVAAKLPEVANLLEYEVAAGRGGDLLDALKAVNPKSYKNSMATWVALAAKKIRDVQNATKDTTGSYAPLTNDQEGAKFQHLVVSSPLIIDRYLREMLVSRTNPTQKEFEDLNALVAGVAPGYRQVFETPLQQLIKKNTYIWIQTFREEPLWIQVKLLPIMIAAGGPDVIRELLWLSTHHKDMRLRALANKALDDMSEAKDDIKK